MKTLRELGYVDPDMGDLTMDVVESHERLDDYGVEEGGTLSERIRKLFVMFTKEFAKSVQRESS